MWRSRPLERGLTLAAALACAWLAAAGRAQPLPSPPPVGGDDPRGDAERLYAGRCAACHGATGAGDGPTAARLVPRPPSFRDPRWQAATSDEAIVAVIVRGGSAVGKSWTMAPNPDLLDRPDVTGALVDKIRGFAPKPLLPGGHR